MRSPVTGLIHVAFAAVALAQAAGDLAEDVLEARGRAAATATGSG